jgi:thiol:disulfide interchange protein DsbC
MTNRCARALAALALGLHVATPALADPPDATARLAERLQARYPSTHFGEIQPTPWPGVFEVVLGKQLAYVDASGQYFLFGHLFDMSAQRDLTAERKDRMARIDFTQLPLADALKEVRGNGTRTLVIFSDPDCPYCRRLEADLAPLTDVTIHTFLLPLASIHPQARSKAMAVWCAQNPIGAWRALMQGKDPTPIGDCPHPIDRNIALADRLGITGTPTLIAHDGRLLAGAASREAVETWLDRDTRDAGR